MKSRAVVVFGRRPEQGAVKTRLAADLGAVAATQLYKAMLCDTLATAQNAGRVADAEIVLAYTPAGAFDAGNTSLARLWRGRRLVQNGDDLGARIQHVIKSLQQRGAQSVLVIGSDAPDLPVEILVNALALLATNRSLENCVDIVCGASEDGGFCLIGARRALPAELFANVAWSTQSTLAQVLANASRPGLTVDSTSLPVWRDVDTLDDLQALATRLEVAHSHATPGDAPIAPHTARWLRAQSTLKGEAAFIKA